MNNYYEEVEHIIRKNEVNKKARILEDNYETLENYWNIGRLIVEAQGGINNVKYGNGLIKEWPIRFTKFYGNNYSYSNMARFRQFYIMFPSFATVWRNLSWSLIKVILPIKEETKRNYYINLCIENNLSVRELISEIKSNSYERLVSVPEKIAIINTNKEVNISGNVMNPIIITLNKNETINNERDLQIKILSELQTFFRQLGNGFALIGNEYKISYNGKNYYIDLLLFNYKYNLFAVVELKIRELRKEDKSQIKFYMDLVDKCVKEKSHNKTIGFIISKRQDEFIATYVGDEDVITLTYLLNYVGKPKKVDIL